MKFKTTMISAKHNKIKEMSTSLSKNGNFKISKQNEFFSSRKIVLINIQGINLKQVQNKKCDGKSR